GESEDVATVSSTSPPPQVQCMLLSAMKVSSAAPGSLQHTLEERAAMYTAALQNAKSAGETSKARRFERGLKTLEMMLAAVKKGRPVNEAEIPPPVSTGAPSAASSAAPRPAAPKRPAPPVPPRPEPTPSAQQEESEAMLLERQREYKMAALRAKKQGDVEQAKLHFKESKVSYTRLETSEVWFKTEKCASVVLCFVYLVFALKQISSYNNRHIVNLYESVNVLFPSAPAAPRDVLDALEQRRAKYAEASAQAKASGDDRKARMHDRIAKQYQSAIRAHKAGKAVDFDELPVPPGFPPIPGQKATGAEQGFVAALEAADKLASTDPAEVPDEEEVDEEKEEKVAVSITLSFLIGFFFLWFLEGRKRQYLKAALQAKQKNDLEQAKNFLRSAKGLDATIETARSGKTVDISALPSPPGDEEDDFILVHHSDVQISEKAEQVYTQLAKILKEQYEKCMTHSKQFTHLGNVSETTKFEKMADSCKQSLEVLKLAQSRGLAPPKHHFEERSFHTVRIFPELSSTDMVVVVVKGMNLPAPSGIQANDLDAYVKVDFPYPSSEQPQKHKTTVIKNTNSPDYNQSFTLSINRNHRGFRRVVTSKGLKLELLHKGGFLRNDKSIGTALVKLDKLETQSEIREIVEVMDGRKPTGGRIEVKVRLREPLSGQDMQTSTERRGII
uniref:Coiled-coil and C2 domain-containing protein 1B n=1 Tax=Scophthalmus maximus TaxID=52904 RepID=A0A8D3D4S6_SCOMX